MKSKPLRAGRRGPHPVLDDDDPLAGMVNLFDLAIVFAVGLIVALVVAGRGRGLVTAPSPSNVELSVPEGKRLVHYRTSGEKGRGPGSRIGTAYRLPNGEIIYVPETPAPGDPPGGAAP